MPYKRGRPQNPFNARLVNDHWSEAILTWNKPEAEINRRINLIYSSVDFGLLMLNNRKFSVTDTTKPQKNLAKKKQSEQLYHDLSDIFTLFYYKPFHWTCSPSMQLNNVIWSKEWLLNVKYFRHYPGLHINFLGQLPLRATKITAFLFLVAEHRNWWPPTKKTQHRVTCMYINPD